jgi:uncharacterized protein (DUF433 family)
MTHPIDLHFNGLTLQGYNCFWSTRSPAGDPLLCRLTSCGCGFTGAVDRLTFAMLDWTECKSVERVPGRVSGAFVFKGTRLPVATLFENLEAGATVSDFLKWYEGVTREQVLEVLRHAERSLVAV